MSYVLNIEKEEIIIFNLIFLFPFFIYKSYEERRERRKTLFPSFRYFHFQHFINITITLTFFVLPVVWWYYFSWYDDGRNKVKGLRVDGEMVICLNKTSVILSSSNNLRLSLSFLKLIRSEIECSSLFLKTLHFIK